MNLREALEQIHRDSPWSYYIPDKLFAFPNEDQMGGRDVEGYGNMSLYQDEGRILYALIRLLRPETVIEVGVASGASSAHLLNALHRNGTGVLHSYDLETEVGRDVPDGLRYRWALHTGEDALTAEMPDHADFVFEDGSHLYPWTRDMLLRLKSLRPRIIFSHDFYTHRTYPDFKVEESFMEVFPDGKGVQLTGTITGLGYVWLNGSGE